MGGNKSDEKDVMSWWLAKMLRGLGKGGGGRGKGLLCSVRAFFNPKRKMMISMGLRELVLGALPVYLRTYLLLIYNSVKAAKICSLPLKSAISSKVIIHDFKEISAL